MVEWLGSAGKWKVVHVGEVFVVVEEEGVALVALALVEAVGIERGDSCMPEMAPRRS